MRRSRSRASRRASVAHSPRERISAARSPRRSVASSSRRARWSTLTRRTPTLTRDDEDEDDEDDEDKAKEAAATALLLEDRPDWFSAQIAEGQAATVAKYARNFLPILFNLFVAAPPERRGELSATVGCFAQITETAALGGFFRTVLRKLVKVTSDAEDAPDALQEGGDTKSARRCTFMDLSLAMVPGLDNAARDLVFKAARPAALEKDAAVQKRAYKLLAALMKPALGPGANLGGDWLVANAEARGGGAGGRVRHVRPGG
jgi:ribosomal RNA-processing protein 12